MIFYDTPSIQNIFLGVIMCLDVRFVDVFEKQPTDNNLLMVGKPRILVAGRVNSA
jgi:hypothetical protein